MRRGTILLLVLVSVLIAGALMVSVVRSTTLRRAQQRQEFARWQASRLADSGLARAAARLASDANYRGETWNIPAEALGGRPGRVTIALTPDPRGEAPWLVSATASWPALEEGASLRARSQVTRAARLHPSGNEGEKP